MYTKHSLQFAPVQAFENNILKSTLHRLFTAGLHNSESSKGQIDQRKFACGSQKCSPLHFVVVWKKFWNDN